MLYENEYYEVLRGIDADEVINNPIGYRVVNKRTGVIELEAQEYPKCLVYAKQGAEIIESIEGAEFDEGDNIVMG